MADSASIARLRRQELFRLLHYDPHPGQIRVHRSKARHRVLACGTRWGKSTLGANESIVELLKPRENAIGWLVAPTYDLTRRIFDRVVLGLQQHLAPRIVAYRPRDHEIVVTNLGGGTSILRAKTADNRVSLLGEGLDWVVVDEAAQLPATTWDEHISARLIDRRGTSLLLSTPVPGGEWFYKAWWRGQKGRDPETESWRSPSWENPHLDRAVIEAERSRLPKGTFAQQYEAQFLGVPKEPCETCGGPRKDVPAWIELPEGQTEENLRFCPECGMIIGEDGLCIVRLWNPWAAHLDVDMPWSESMVSYAWNDPTGRCQWTKDPY